MSEYKGTRKNGAAPVRKSSGRGPKDETGITRSQVAEKTKAAIRSAEEKGLLPIGQTGRAYNRTTPEKYGRLIYYIASGATKTVACRAANISRDWVYDRMATNAEVEIAFDDEESESGKRIEKIGLKDAVQMAEDIAEQRAVQAVQSAFFFDWKAAAWWLERRRPKEWTKTSISASMPLSKMNDEQVAAAAREAFGGMQMTVTKNTTISDIEDRAMDSQQADREGVIGPQTLPFLTPGMPAIEPKGGSGDVMDVIEGVVVPQ